MTKWFFGIYDTNDKENMKNPTPTPQATIGELFKVLMGSMYAQMLHQYQNNYIQLLYCASLLVVIIVVYSRIRFKTAADLFNVGLTIVYSPIQWLTKTKVHYPVPIMSVPSYIPPRFTEDRDFNHWLRTFERYASRLKDKTGALLTLIEESCLIKLEQRLLQQKPNASYEEIIEVLTNLYGKDAQYHDPLREFVSRRQRPIENVYNYLSELESLARAAHPDQRQALLEPMILDRFIRGIHDVKIKQELCKSSPIGSINETLKKASELEKAFSRCNAESQGINGLQCGQYNNDIPQHRANFTTKPNQDWCTNCTHHKHLAKDCLRNKRASRPSNCMATTRVRACYNRSEPDQSAAQRIQVYKHDEIEGVCLLNELPIKYTLDTGAEITVISDRAYSSLKHPTILEPVPNLIASAGGSGLTVLGRTYAQITIGEVSIFTFLVVIKDLVVDCLLGMDLLQQFPFFKKPIDELRKVVVQMSKQVTIEPRFYLMNVYNSSRYIRSVTDINIDKYMNKIQESIKSIAASSLRELKPSQCFEHTIHKDDDSDGAHKHVNVISNRIECEATDPTQRVVVTTEEQDRDEDILWAKNLVRIHGDEQPTLKKIELDSHFKRAVYHNYEHLRLVDETLFLYRESENGERRKLTLLPTHMVTSIFQFIHCSVFHGHLGSTSPATTSDKTTTTNHMRYYRPTPSI
ncbi:KRAB-A domain-containing [Brachionus plicatilis]|uniref:KRAB-A domain-containing n=1 Tax=Brachionus plicatilis TaxID=10195 RepID=A0A3M7SDJ3_BRAPC|nr:KRAB-A domain-containing [Brachionus plicatilis]